MCGCCNPSVDLSKRFDCKVEETANGITISVTSDDQKKAEALKSLMKARRELCGDDCCTSEAGSSCC